jgi:hypothetical protein
LRGPVPRPSPFDIRREPIHENGRQPGEFVVKRTLLVATPSLGLLIALPAAAEMFGPDYKPCADRPNTLAIVDCVDANTKL